MTSASSEESILGTNNLLTWDDSDKIIVWTKAVYNKSENEEQTRATTFEKVEKSHL